MVAVSFAAAVSVPRLQPRSDLNATLVNSTACAPVHLLLARGTTETYPGSLETLAELVTAANPGADYENIIYPATQETDTDSYPIGRAASRAQVTAYVEKCPDAKIVILAYSQVSRNAQALERRNRH